MANTLPDLLTAPDTVEVVRDQIYEIIRDNALEQETTLGGGADYRMRVFRERTRPFDLFANDTQRLADDSPVVNVWFETENFPLNLGDRVEKQIAAGVFNVDVYAVATTKPDATNPTTEDRAGDEESMFRALRAARYVRQFLMAAMNTNLQIPGTIYDRWVGAIDKLPPELLGDSALDVVGVRVTVEVNYQETGIQTAGTPITRITVDANRLGDDVDLYDTQHPHT